MPNMDEVVRQKQLYFPLSKLDEFEREFKTVPVDGEGRALAFEYNEIYVRGTILKLIADVRLLIEEREQDKEYLNGLIGPDRLNANRLLIAENEQLKAKVAEQEKENKELRETLGVMHYELTGLEPHLEMPERGFVRNSFNSILRWAEPYRTE